MKKNYKFTDSRISLNRNHKKNHETLRHIIIKLLKTSDKEKILKIHQRKKRNIRHRRTKIRMTVEFLSEIMPATNQYSNILKELKKKNY